ncbi:fluoroacetate dehalogenase [Streptomyces sulfonofaciens]|uniref:Fluoroacetate dehalogenase n=1 Tax=Streptomyces sulfonofaciens TaxID=68272 RepID=A0A919KT98_9ACTN|nr:alpha/beta hydrolase [Streptomyces sulfonofaciens]GHH71592.1 fluoroacetate dehalogenase [Streptomyces sulfonofaciens]
MNGADRLPGPGTSSAESAFLTEFQGFDVDVDGVRIHGRVGGSGPPVLLLHGFPQTHLAWRYVAPRLARDHTVVAADLRGYGDSGKPPAGPDHSAYGKRAMAADQVGLMARLGFDRFAAVGHDRGARVVHRMALDHPHAVERAAVLDIVPTRHVYATVDRALGEAYFHWFFLTQPAGLPETLIGGAPEFFLHRLLGGGLATTAGPSSAWAEYARCFRTPEAIAAMCEDYRAAATIDLEHDGADAAAGQRITCPLLVLWGKQGFVGRTYDPLAVWHEYAHNRHGTAVDAGHFLPEENPDETVVALAEFLG